MQAACRRFQSLPPDAGEKRMAEKPAAPCAGPESAVVKPHHVSFHPRLVKGSRPNTTSKTAPGTKHQSSKRQTATFGRLWTGRFARVATTVDSQGHVPSLPHPWVGLSILMCKSHRRGSH